MSPFGRETYYEQEVVDGPSGAILPCSHFFLVVKWAFMTLNAAHIQLVMKKRRRLTGSMVNLGTAIHIIYHIHEIDAIMEQSWNRQ